MHTHLCLAANLTVAFPPVQMCVLANHAQLAPDTHCNALMRLAMACYEVL